MLAPSSGSTGTLRFPQLPKYPMSPKAIMSGPIAFPGRRSRAMIPPARKARPPSASMKWFSGTPRWMLTHSPPSDPGQADDGEREKPPPPPRHRRLPSSTALSAGAESSAFEMKPSAPLRPMRLP